uniref:Post-glycosylphosphatidylinositol attachment to proteins 6 n=1 Tax=Neogobius melanostomus TaxID=47308 RepID=A0A8C6TPU1_9GOBI
MEQFILRGVLLFFLAAAILADDGQVTFVSELASKPAQKLSKYGWYGNVRLQRFHIPEETAVARWVFTVTKHNNFNCGQYNVSIYLRWGAPPVINPVGTVFPIATLWSPPYSLSVPVTSQTHLPEDDGRIQQKGFPSCSYFFQPQLSIRKLNWPFCLLRLYVPEFTSSVSLWLTNCSSEEQSDSCSVVLRLGSRTLQEEPLLVSCSGTQCSATLPNPPWDTWLQVVVETNHSNRTVTFSIVSHYTGLLNPLFITTYVRVNTSEPKAVLRLPYPQSATWYLTLQLTCNGTNCGNASVVSVVPEVFVSACIEDCGTYGECRLIRSFTYLYASCSCKAGWSGWGCTDGSKALSYSRQLTAALMLTISNLFFIPAIVVAVRRWYITEASVYLFTMFFSTFYHACDQPGVAVMCIMDYDALQYCDFLGSVCSIWVTILCMARSVFAWSFAVGLIDAVGPQGLWNMLGPVLCALLILVAAWVYRGVKRHHCYPSSWRRWVFFLLPGALCALIAVSVFVFAQTEDNYYYTHSLWHILVAGCVVFLLPPKEKHREQSGWTQGFSWAWSWRPRVCGYTLCESGKDELYTVT